MEIAQDNEYNTLSFGCQKVVWLKKQHCISRYNLNIIMVKKKNLLPLALAIRPV